MIRELPTALVRYDDGSTVARYADGREEPYAIPPQMTVVRFDAPGQPFVHVHREHLPPAILAAQKAARDAREARERLEELRPVMSPIAYSYALHALLEEHGGAALRDGDPEIARELCARLDVERAHRRG